MKRAIAIVLGALVLAQTHDARAQEGVRKLYVGATFGVEGGVSVAKLYSTFEGDVFLGYRISRWFSIEGGTIAGVGNGRWQGEGAGAMCAGSDSHAPRRETVDLRLWVHVMHMQQLDISVAPVIGLGLGIDDVTYGVAHGPCFEPPQTVRSLAFLGGLALGFELRASPAMGFRIVLENGIDTAMGVLYGTTWLGPVFRF